MPLALVNLQRMMVMNIPDRDGDLAGGKITTAGTQSVTTDQGEVASDFKEVRWLDKDGAMIVETTRTVNGSSRTTTTAYKKKA